MRTPAGLRRFPSSHPSLLFSIFSGILENRVRGDRGGGLNRAAGPWGGGATGPPVAPGAGDRRTPPAPAPPAPRAI